MELEDVRFYNNEVFTSEDNFEFIVPDSGKWFDYCPCDGVMGFKEDKDNLWHFNVKDMGDHFLIATVPNCGDDRYESFDDEDCKTLSIQKFIKSEAYNYVNDFNKSRCIYKVGDACLNMESIFVIGGDLIFQRICENYDECIAILDVYGFNFFNI